jgi:hypothetical protein
MPHRQCVSGSRIQFRRFKAMSCLLLDELSRHDADTYSGCQVSTGALTTRLGSSLAYLLKARPAPVFTLRNLTPRPGIANSLLQDSLSQG